MALLKRDLGLEDRHGLATDPYAGEVGAGEFELDLDASGPVQGVSLNAGQARACAAAGEQPEVRKIRPEEPVRIAADRVLGDPECRTEHARLGQMVRGVRLEGEDEVARGADLRRQGREAREIGFELLQVLRPAHADQQPRAGRADDAQRQARVETLGGECQRIENRQALAIVELAPEERRRAADGDAAVLVVAAHLDVDDARLGLLALPARRLVASRQHVLRGDGGVADEAGLTARREEARTHGVIVAVGRENEGGLGVIELAGDREHLRLGKRIGVQPHSGRVAGKGLAGERVNLMNLDLPRHRFSSAVRTKCQAILVLGAIIASAHCSARAILRQTVPKGTSMDIGVEISLYPLQRDFVPAIREFLGRLNADARLRVVTNSMSTQVFGTYEDVMEALRRELRTTLESLQGGADKAVFVMKVLGPLAPA